MIELLKDDFDLSKNFIYPGAYVPSSFREHISSYKRIGQYKADKKELDILIVNLKNKTTLERARSTQRNFIREYLNGSRNGNLKDAALVAFTAQDSDNWRFSFVKMQYRFNENGKIYEDTTPATRYSFLVGKNERNHTAKSRFLELMQKNTKPTLKDIEDAFSVERVTNEFFVKYRELFIKTVNQIDKIFQSNLDVKREFEAKNITSVDFAKKLLGQIVFLYFLQKKGWLGLEKDKYWGEGDKNFIRNLFNKAVGEGKNFFNDYLEYLFYDALNNARSTQKDPSWHEYLTCKIPFLNGGLFEPFGNYDWKNVDLLVSNELFSNNNKDGILDIFDLFNFTVKEDEPLEKEVAIDPELLGKIYEKLNAIRQDNFEEYKKAINNKASETKFNKEFGVYYTPREIVHYMAQSALVEYLYENLKDKAKDLEDLKEDLKTFVFYSEQFKENDEAAIKMQKKIEEGEQKSSKYSFKTPEFIKENADIIDHLLENIKIIDPAIGSGAFPIGVMHEIVKMRQLLSIYLNKEVNLYTIKRYCIENSLYGVDIDPGAIETCKLRFWLSMVVDETDFNNIKPLPNLDYKIVRGDSLLKIENDLFNEDLLDKIEKLKLQYFNETDSLKKQDLRKEINELIYAVTNGHEEFDFKVYFSEVFNQKNGFDIAIGNPPYIQLQKYGGRLANNYKKFNYQAFDRRGDIYALFYEKGMKILKDNGHLCFITSNKWMRAGYGEKLREFFIGYNPKILIDLGPGVFESATVDTNILLIQKSKVIDQHRLDAVTLNKISDNQISISQQLAESGVIINKLTKDAWFIGSNAEQQLKEKIEHIGKPLKEWDVKIYRGILTGLNEAFIINTETRNKILADCRNEEERRLTEKIIKPILRGRDIKRYCYEWAGLWVIVTKYGFYKYAHLYPTIVNHLKQFEKKLRDRGQCRYTRTGKNKNIDYEGQHHWIELDNNPKDFYLAEFEKEKVVYSEIVRKPQFYFDADKFYVEATGFLMTGENMKYICGLLNSEPITYFFKQWYAGGGLGEEGYRYKKAFLENIPIPPITHSNQLIVKQIEALVDKILASKKENHQTDTSEWERQIDHLVYQLYDLTPQEIEVVENSNL
ncbi:MAG: TaqI-like C-terminal specificity domain-containing protein [Candidatus Bilamarchaeaceae archaeon]